MKYLPLVWAMLWRRKVRTGLTFASIVVAFMLFGMLEALHSVFNLGARIGGADTLLVGHRFGNLGTLPYAYRSQIESIPGVVIAGPLVVFPITYGGGPSATQPSLAIDPEGVFKDNRFIINAEHRDAFRKTRTGLVAGRDLAQKYGWKVGDHVTVQSPWLKRKDGGSDWEFDVVGLFHFNPEILGEGVSAMRVFVRYDYVDEARVDPGHVNLFMVKVDEVARVGAVGREIDRRFDNSANPTKSQTESEQLRETVEQIGDIGLIMTAILSAVFFTLVVVAGNTMMRAFRERIPELAVLKTLGYGEGLLARMVAAESLLLCTTAGFTGLLLAWLLLKPMAKAVASFLPLLRMEPGTVWLGIGLAGALGVVAAIVPAWQSARLTITQGLVR